MNERRRHQLRKEYQRLRDKYNECYDQYSCGITLAEHISADLAKWGRRMREIESEVKVAMGVTE